MNTRYREEAGVRVIIETLNQSRNGRNVDIEQVASRARTSSSFATEILHDLLGLTDSSAIEITPNSRFRLAFEAASKGGLREAARALTWQEFEEFTEGCLESAGFQTFRGLSIRGQGRRWQVDLVAKRGRMMLVFDCKHWNTPNYPSKFKAAASHQKLATTVLIHNLRTKRVPGTDETCALPVILTLFDPRTQVADDVVLVSIEKLPDFLNGISPYSPGLPFITDETPLQNPIR